MEQPFESIPAWRIAKLRTALREAERQGATMHESSEDIEHRALRRRFEQGRRTAMAGAAALGKARTTRKGRRFSLAKQILIWREIIKARPPDWKQGDKAASGSIRRAHAAAAQACRAARLVPPRYRTVYVLWHRGVPSPAVLAALKSAYGA